MDAKVVAMIEEIDRGGLEYALSASGIDFTDELNTGDLRLAVGDEYRRGNIAPDLIIEAWESTP